ncbi:hypothetical protein GCM10009734_58130 [Nonomuraea bangladeshensis]
MRGPGEAPSPPIPAATGPRAPALPLRAHDEGFAGGAESPRALDTPPIAERRRVQGPDPAVTALSPP